MKQIIYCWIAIHNDFELNVWTIIYTHCNKFSFECILQPTFFLKLLHNGLMSGGMWVVMLGHNHELTNVKCHRHCEKYLQATTNDSA